MKHTILIAVILFVGCNAKHEQPSIKQDTLEYDGHHYGLMLDSVHFIATKIGADTVYIHDTVKLNSYAATIEVLQSTFHEGFNQGAISAMKLVNQNNYSYKNIMKEYIKDSINYYNAIIKPLVK